MPTAEPFDGPPDNRYGSAHTSDPPRYSMPPSGRQLGFHGGNDPFAWGGGGFCAAAAFARPWDEYRHHRIRPPPLPLPTEARSSLPTWPTCSATPDSELSSSLETNSENQAIVIFGIQLRPSLQTMLQKSQLFTIN